MLPGQTLCAQLLSVLSLHGLLLRVLLTAMLGDFTLN